MRDVDTTGEGGLLFSSFANVDTGRSTRFNRFDNTICALKHTRVSILEQSVVLQLARIANSPVAPMGFHHRPTSPNPSLHHT